MFQTSISILLCHMNKGDFGLLSDFSVSHIRKRQIFSDDYVYQCSCGSVVEHCVISAKVVGSIPSEHTY